MIVGVVCSQVFLIVGVLLGVVSVYLILRVRGRLSGPTSPSPPPLTPPATYEEVGVASEKSHDIQLTSYAPLHKDNMHTTLHMDKSSCEQITLVSLTWWEQHIATLSTNIIVQTVHSREHSYRVMCHMICTMVFNSYESLLTPSTN